MHKRLKKERRSNVEVPLTRCRRGFANWATSIEFKKKEKKE